MTRKSRRFRITKLVFAISCSLIASAGTVVADDEMSRVRHFLDSSTDRVPAMTSFPEYPSVARRDRIEGEATVCFKIKASGKISRIKVESSTHRIFSKPALRAMRASSFEPLAPAQILSSTRVCRTYRFRLDPVVVGNDTT